MWINGITVDVLGQYPWASIVVAYVLGALPFAVLIGKIAGVDPRNKGSGNPGASNVTRVMGLQWGILTLVLDASKSALACLLALPLGLGWAALAGVVSVFAHCTSPFLGFKGGRGVASTLGCLLILHPGLMGICLFIWICVLMTTRKPAWASVAMAFCLVLTSHLQGVSDEIKSLAIATASIIVIRHWVYIQQLLGQKKPKKRTQVQHIPKKISKKNRSRKQPKVK